MQVCTSLQTDNRANTCKKQAGCPSCHPTNSIKTLKALSTTFIFYAFVDPIDRIGGIMFLGYLSLCAYVSAWAEAFLLSTSTFFKKLLWKLDSSVSCSVSDVVFCVAAPRALNRLLTELKLLQSITTFCRQLKTFLFQSACGQAPVVSQ